MVSEPIELFGPKSMADEEQQPLIGLQKKLQEKKHSRNLRRLKYSCEEVYERMDNGLCIFCDELDTPGHHDLKHKGIQIFMVDCDDEVSEDKEEAHQETVKNPEPFIETKTNVEPETMKTEPFIETLKHTSALQVPDSVNDVLLFHKMGSLVKEVGEVPQQSTNGNDKTVAHQLFDQMPLRKASKEKQRKYLKAWKFKFKPTSKRSKSMDVKFFSVEEIAWFMKDSKEIRLCQQRVQRSCGWFEKELKPYGESHKAAMFLYSQMQVVKSNPAEFKTFDRKRSNKTLHLEDKQDDEHEQNQVIKLISSWTNRIWEPGGVLIEHNKWKGSEKHYELSRVMILMQGLSSTWWSYGKVAELTQELQQPKTYLKGIKLKEFDRLAMCSCVAIKTWLELCSYEYKIDMLLLDYYGLEVQVLPCFKEECVIVKMNRRIVLCLQELKSIWWFGYNEGVGVTSTKHELSNWSVAKHVKRDIHESFGSKGLAYDSCVLLGMNFAGFGRGKTELLVTSQKMQRMNLFSFCCSCKNQILVVIHPEIEENLEFKQLLAAVERFSHEVIEEWAKGIVIEQKIEGCLICGDLKFHLKHKWRSKLLQTPSGLEDFVENVVPFTSLDKLFFTKNHKPLHPKTGFCIQYNDLEQLNTEQQSSPGLNYFTYLSFIWKQVFNCGCGAGHITSGSFSVGDVHELFICSKSQKGDETYGKKLLDVNEVSLLDNDNKVDFTIKASWCYHKPMIREVFHLQRPPEVIDLQGNPHFITNVLVQWKEHPPDQFSQAFMGKYSCFHP